MNPFGEIDGYAIARRTLIQAIRALQSLPSESFVLIGAQAVYLRAPEGITAIAPFTTDGDLAANPSKIGRASYIYDALEQAGFSLRNRYGGMYEKDGVAADERSAAKIDILVPEASAHLWNADAYTNRDIRATGSQPGIELCLVDFSPMEISHIIADPNEHRVTVQVASVLALLIAKGWKIGERYDQGSEAFQDVQKDVADIYRLLLAADWSTMTPVLSAFPTHSPLRAVAKRGADELERLCTSSGPAVQLLAEILGRSNEAQIILDRLEALTEEFVTMVRAALTIA